MLSKVCTPLLLGLLLSLPISQVALADSFKVSDFATVPGFPGTPSGCVIDGPFETTTDGSGRIMAPTDQLSIDRSCTVKNFSCDIPLESTLNFAGAPEGTLIIFDNVCFGGNFACANVEGKASVWAVNGSDFSTVREGCQNLIIPVEKIEKRASNLAGTPISSVTIGVPFVYTLDVPVLYDPVTGTVLQDSGSLNDIDSITIWDDLSLATLGVDLELLDIRAYYESASGVITPMSQGSDYLVSNSGNDKDPGVLTFEIRDPATLPAGAQVHFELEVMLEDSTDNAIGTLFTNIASWEFARVIDGTRYDPLPGENGIAQLLSISAPDLVLNKSTSSTAVNFVDTPTYTLSVQNVGGAPAWNIVIEDELPLEMREFDPTTQPITVTMAGTQLAGTDYTVSYDAGTGLLTIGLLKTAGGLAPNAILEITYSSQLNSVTNVPTDGDVLTNTAAATLWYNDSEDNPDRVEYARLRTDGTPNTVDHEDAASVTAALTGYYFEKTVSNVTAGESPATVAAPGDRLRYTLRLFNLDQDIYNVEITDQLDPSKFDLASAAVDQTTCPPVATCTVDTSSGLLSISGDLDVVPGSSLATIEVAFEVDTLATLTTGDLVSNQAQMDAQDANTGGNALSALSDDPNVNGVLNQADRQGKMADPTDVIIFSPQPLLKQNPSDTSVTIGEVFNYTITVPATSMPVALYDVHVLDTLPPNVEFVSASAVVGGTTSYNLSNSGTATDLILEETITGLDIPANQQAVVTLQVRVKNDPVNQDTATPFTNAARYTFSRTQGGSQSDGTGTEGSTSGMSIVEPLLVATKNVANVTSGKNTTDPAQGGDTLQYTVTLTNNGSSTAFDINLEDLLPTGLALDSSFTPTLTINGTDPGFNPSPAQAGNALTWGRDNNGDDSLDIPVGQTLTLTYRVLVNSIDGSDLVNNVVADWTSLDGPAIQERTGSDAPDPDALNNYFTTASSTINVDYNVGLTKAYLSDSWNDDGNVRVGDTVEYELQLALGEGTHNDLVLTDTLPAGMAFVEMVSADYFGAAPPVLPTPVVSADQRTITWTLSTVDNPIDGDPANDFLTIVYRARVLNGDALNQIPTTQTLTNRATLDFANAGSPVQLVDTADIAALQPLLAVTKSAVTGIDGDTSIRAGETATYTVDITNSGTAPAYDTVLVDILPVGLRQGGVTTVSATLVNSGTSVTITPTYDAATGIVSWDFDPVSNAVIAPGDTLRVVYEVTGDADLGAGLTLTNSAQVTRYYSFDNGDVPVNSIADWREDYGPTEVATFALVTPMPGALRKATTQNTVAIGESLTYTITIPDVPIETALQDVRIMDDLSATGVDLRFVSATEAGQPLNNSGTSDNLVLYKDGGLNVPAGEQVEVLVTVEVLNTQNNRYRTAPFVNRAWYDYDNGVERQGDDATRGDDANPVTIVHPELVVEKTGPASMRVGSPDSFTLVAENIGESSAWNVTLTDLLPNPTPGGLCTVQPLIQTAVIEKADSSTISLTASDFAVNFVPGEPVCEFTATLQTDDELAPGDRLILSYQVELDEDNLNGSTLVNVAGATEWFSGDASNSQRVAYQRQLTDGTPGVVDYQDSHEFIAEAAILETRKSVFNVTTGESGANASPGDRLRYTIEIANVSDLPQNDFTLTDELDRLNGIALFEAGSIAIDNSQTQVPADATVNVVGSGGANGTGLLQVSNLDISPAGQAGDSLTIVFEATLAPVITSNTIVFNQAELSLSGVVFGSSDDPTISGTEDPTETLISSSPLLTVEKTSADISGDADLLLAGDTLRYTIRVQNSGNENTAETMLRDQVPANTTYVANSTTVNGASVADVDGGSPLSAGLTINSPGAGEGVMLADPSDAANTEAVITFDVTINDVAEGTLISNQGYVTGEGAGSGPHGEVLSDDPTTDTPGDPTIDIVGDVPALVVQKVVAIHEDNLSQGIVDPGDTLRYTITVNNIGGVDATEVELTDLIPANTTYVSGSTTLNGIAVGDNGGGEARVATGLPISSEDLTPPLPGALEGVISSARTATIVFDVTVDAGTATGTVISNQGSVASTGLPLVLTDADGNPTNGAQSTDVVVGDAQQLSISKAVTVIGGTAEAGATLEYLVTVTNIGAVPASNVILSDDLLVAGDGVLTYVADSARLNGRVDGVSVNGSVITANYSSVYGELQPQGSATLRFQAKLGADLAIGTTVVNTAMVEWNDPPSSELASVSIDVGGTPGVASLAGYLWQDVNFNAQSDADEQLLQNWTVELYFNGNLVETVQSDENGYFQFDGLLTNITGGASYELRYVAPGAGVNTASLGNADSEFTNGPQQITEIYVASGANLQDLNLPLTPNGVVYDSVVRGPVAGATLTMLRASSGVALPDSCFDDPKQQGQVTQASGFYKFDINFSGAGCPAGSDYLIQVELPGDNYVAGESAIIPPQTNADTAGFDVAACLGTGGDAVPATTEHCEAQASPTSPSLDIDAQSPATDYYLRLTLDDNRIPGESQLFNNHIAVDPQLDGALSITKTAAMLNVTRSQLVPYTITFTNTLPVPLTDLRLVDFFPAGFKYVAGSAQVDGMAVEPQIEGLQLIWTNLRVDPDQTRTVKLLLVVGSGVGEDEYINRARLFNDLSGQVVSGEASATVRVIPDPTFDCTDVIGKVYDDKNMNGYQDPGEGGVPGARVVTATGLNATTDAYGRFHITCAVVPDRDRGSNFVLKLDDRSLPSGYRLTSENPRIVRATRGKMIKVNFGSSLHRVVRLDMAEAVFEPQTTELRPQWHSRTELLLEKLQEAPSVLRLSYLAENEDPDLVEQRLETIKAQITEEWARNYGDYELTIETEVFWRRGAPPSKGGLE
ncbi:isopeptide-forming domain-containing fimbrial protein [Microbulbifer marinus]|uniref:isopeptide-forming domain-containing fimbrial protein n=1 Tax=Microbulbifer marinus TaxID=658218 RepID=UPI00147EBE19|nr:isopeptide-forming domain-containing fimbrial protein [Microbulbifer marinus]